MPPSVDVELTRVATGGAALGTGPDGRVVFAAGGLPGELVTVAIDREHARRLEGRVTGVLRPSPHRTPPPCPHVAAGCGGCDWQHVAPAHQPRLRADIVADCLRRLARIEDPDLRPGQPLRPDGYRITVRAAVRRGRAGFRAARSHDVVPVDSCLVAHPLAEEILVDGRFGSATEITVRVGARTGERLVVATPTAAGVRVPDGVVVVGDDDLRAGHPAAYHEEVGGRRLRISARSFFQSRPDGAEALAAAAGAALGPPPPAGPTLTGAGAPRLLDAYCGVGLFAALLGDGWAVTGVESNRSSTADAAVNLAAHQPGAAVVTSRMERWQPQPMSAVIADPARAGLGRDAARRLAATGAPVLVLISCDPASLARDATLLAGHGYRLDHVTVVDLFGHTSHVETVSRFELGPGGAGR